ncbi:ABC transporter permease [Anaerosporobacter sp.]|uniref:ABC transporter permease n=1 Tax=Anaerosporobacter sp. TaxID=1872529 RepID=UPI00286ED64A|nr:ABC transporter permease [Anaerosporobacter sp.]
MMNIILLLFIIMVSTFISSSVNNLMSISNAMDEYIEISEIADFTIVALEAGSEKTNEFVETNENIKSYVYYESPILSADNCDLNGKKFDYSNTIVVSDVNEAKVKLFDGKNNVITPLNDGEIMLTAVLKNLWNLKEGDKITIHNGEFSKEYKYVGCTKDMVFCSSMTGITRMIVSENDYQDIMKNGGFSKMYCYGIESNNVEELENDFGKIGAPIMITLADKQLKMLYIMDMVIAGVMLLVSVVLILISIVILRFTIVFTLNEEFREIGVMKAIGIKNRKIRGIYIVKYLAISIVGSLIGFFVGIPFGKLMIKDVSNNIVIKESNSLLINAICCVAIVLLVIIFCYLSTRMVKKSSPIDAIRNGSNGERFKRKGILHLNKTKMPTILYMAVNDIFSGLKHFSVLILTFTLGLLLILIPVTTMHTLTSDKLVNWFGLTESDVYIEEEQLFTNDNGRETVWAELEKTEQLLAKNNIPANVFKETVFKFSISYGDKSWNAISLQGTGTSVEDYSYTEGTAPQSANEVEITHVVADRIGAEIGDSVKIDLGDGEAKTFIVTAIYQSMNNMGDGVRFHEDLEINYSNAMGQFATQIKYTDNPSKDEQAKRLETIKELYSDKQVSTGGEYVSNMVGDIAGSMKDMKNVIILVVLATNILVSVLMVKSFIIKETGEIGMLKAIGFKNNSIVLWQTFRIGIVLIISILLGILLENPVGQISSGLVFKMMGASSIEFMPNILEEYVIYPLVVFGVTFMASFLTAQQVRRISASETSNME